MLEILPSDSQPKNPTSSDLLYGANAIADFLGITRRQAYRLTGHSLVPCFKIGGTVAARKSSLTAWMDKQEVI